MTRLRTTAGIIGEDYERRFLLPFTPLENCLQKYASQGYAVLTAEGAWHLTAEGFLISNTIISDLLLLQDQSTPLARRRS
jgi:oxygen-independent coproporphyrinogen-3 oxidase